MTLGQSGAYRDSPAWRGFRISCKCGQVWVRPHRVPRARANFNLSRLQQWACYDEREFFRRCRAEAQRQTPLPASVSATPDAESAA